MLGADATISINHKDIKNRIEANFQDSILHTKFRQVMEDLYRLGFLGNFLPVTQAYRWQHKGDLQVTLTDEWRLCIHYGLHNALSIGQYFDRALNRGIEAQVGDVADFVVNYVGISFATGEFKVNGVAYKGSIHISKFGKQEHSYIRRLSDVVRGGDCYKVTLLQYNEQYSSWELDIVSEQR